jgi:hypothetical protein
MYELGYFWRLRLSVEKHFNTRYNRKSVQDRKHKEKITISVAFALCFMYNRQCWSLTAMMWKVADTPGRFAMASVWKFPWRMSIFKIGERRRENNGKRKNSHSFKSI